MTVHKITSNNFEAFALAFQGSSRRQVGLYGILLDYLICPNNTGNYDMVWNSIKDKLKNCVIFVRKDYTGDAESLYTLLVHNLGMSGPVPNIITKHNNSRNGRS